MRPIEFYRKIVQTVFPDPPISIERARRIVMREDKATPEEEKAYREHRVLIEGRLAGLGPGRTLSDVDLSQRATYARLSDPDQLTMEMTYDLGRMIKEDERSRKDS